MQVLKQQKMKQTRHFRQKTALATDMGRNFWLINSSHHTGSLMTMV